MRKAIIPTVCLCFMGCQDNHVQEQQVTKRCETLLAAQELASLPAPLRNDSRAAIRPKDNPRINDSDASIFIRRSYDRLIDGKPAPLIEARDYTCTFSKPANKITSLMTNGHQQEFRLNDDEYAIMAEAKKEKGR